MVFSVLWTLLPAGFDDDGRARLSLVASPRPAGTTLGASEVLNWPAVVAGLGTRVDVVSPGHSIPIEAAITGPAPDAALWASLFPADTPVAPPAPIAEELSKAETPAASEAHALIKGLYDAAREAGPLDHDHAVMKTVAGLNAWRNPTGAVEEVDALLDPRHLTRGHIRDAGRVLRGRGQAAAAEVVALVPLLRRLDINRSTTDKGPVPPNRDPGPAGAVAPVEQADFHQVISAVLRHPALAERLGLRFTLTMPAFTGARMIRVAFRGSFPAGHKPLPMPWSAVVCDPANHRFVMATQPDPRAEVSGGMLDVRTPDRHAVSDLDPIAVTQQLDLLAGKLLREPGPFVLPARRQAGLTLVQADRRAARYAHMVERNARFEGSSFPEEVEDAPVLYADDVTVGYRVDVAANNGPYRSLMRRNTSFSAGTFGGKREFTVEEEGHLDAVSPVQQYDNADKPHLFVGEEMFGWHGWALSAPFPTPAVGAQTRDDPHVVPVQAEPVPGFPLRISTAVVPGSLTRLRFGTSYSFRVRTVDLAGVSVDPAGIDPALATAPVTYKRVEPLHPPVLAPRRRYATGETLTHLVVTSEGDGVPLADPAERHVAPPKTSQHLAESHGAFDAAFGKDVSQAVRNRMFDLARREEGSFLDPAPGVSVVSPPGATEVTHLPIPRGEPLKPGEYVIVDNPRPNLPYLPDVASDGFALAGVPGAAQPLVVRWTDGSLPWPDRAAPARLVVRAAASNGVTTTVDSGRKVVTVSLAPATRATLRISSTPTAEALGVMEAPSSAGHLDAARKGQRPELTPAQELTVVHAVRKPLTDPVLDGLSILKSPSDPGTALTISATVLADAASTGKVALEASWTDVVDRGYGPVTYEDRRATIASATFEATDTSRPVQAKHDFGDKKHRVVTFRAVSSTRFSEYFPPPTDDSDRSFMREGAGHDVPLLAWRRPTRPVIHSIVPMYRPSYESVANIVTINHLFDGFRVFLKRPFMTSGDGEMLGVVAARDAVAAGELAGDQKYRDLVTRWGTDPLYHDGAFTGAQKFITPEDFFKPGPGATPFSFQDLPEVPIPNGGPPAAKVRVMGYPVVFDPDRNLWRSDVRFPMTQTGNESFARLALVGYRPGEVFEAYPDFRASAMTVSEPIPARATRTVRAFVDGAGPRVAIQVTTPAGGTDNPHKLRVRWQRRAFDPNVTPNPAPDVCVDAAEVNPVQVAFNDGIPGFSVSIKPPVSVTGAALDSLLKGRLVVEELKEGWDIATVGGIRRRPVFTAVIELQDLV